MWWLILPVAIYSIGIFLLWLTLRRSHEDELPEVNHKTKISVIVACRDEEENIGTLLKCLAVQDYPKERFTIVIVDDNSTDNTSAIINEFINISAKPSGLNIILLHNPADGKKRAIRRGITEAEGDLILTTDADCRIGPLWVSAYAAYYEKTGADMILSSVMNVTNRRFASLFAQYEFAALQSITEATALLGHPVMCNGANMGFRRDIYMKYSGELHDDIPSGDDMFLMHSVKRGGGDIRWLAAAVETAAAVSAAALLCQRSRWASKAGIYRDTATLTLAAATAACNATVTAAAIAALLSCKYLILMAILYAIRCIPDYLIISHTMKKRKEHLLLRFIVMELLYPFYFITVAFLSLLPSMRRFKNRTS